ncbi:MAG: nitroreductase family protein [Anaerolineales bacterium]
MQAQVKRSKDRIISAPVAILLLHSDMSEMDRYPDKRRTKAEFRMTVQSVAAAGMQLLLAAHAEGLGAVWACWVLFAVETIRSFGIAEDMGTTSVVLSWVSRWKSKREDFESYEKCGENDMTVDGGR